MENTDQKQSMKGSNKSRVCHEIGWLVGGMVVCLLFAGPQAAAHTIDLIELPSEGGTQVVVDGNNVGTPLPGAEGAGVGVFFNDGNYIPQRINVNLYEDLVRTIVSDTLTITISVENPQEVMATLTSDSEGPLQGLGPEDIALFETGGLQPVVTLTNSNRIETTIRVQSDVPEPSSLVLVTASLLGFLAFRRYYGRNTKGVA